MLRFFVTYRWELLLLLGAPLAGNVASTAVFPVAGFLHDQGWLPAYVVLYGYVGVGGLLEAGLLLALYARVRRLERAFLSLVWGYAILLAAIGGLLTLVNAAATWEVYESDVLVFWGVRFGVYRIILLLPLLWFARQASRFSLAHAYYLLLVLKTSVLATILPRTLNTELVPVGLLVAIGAASVFGVGFLLAWLLGNFDSRSAVFRKRAVAGLLTLFIVSELWKLVELVTVVSDWSEGLFTVAALTTIGLSLMRLLIFVFLPLALIYLVRVRRPAPAPEAQPPTDLRVQ